MRLIKKSPIIFLALVIIISTLLLGCKAAPAGRETIKFGLVAPLSGGGGEWGLMILRASELGIDKMAREGGIKAGGKAYDLKIIPEDGKYSSEAAATAANKLTFQDGAKFQFYMASAECLSGQAITEANNVVTLTASYNDRALGPNHPWTWRIYPPSSALVMGFYKWLTPAHPEVKRVAIFSRNDETGWAMENSIKSEAAKYGLAVVAAERFDPKIMDFYPILTRLLPQKPDIIDTGSCPMNVVAAVAKQSKEMGYNGMIGVSGSGPNLPVLMEVGGKENIQGIVCAGGFNLKSPDITPRQKEYFDEHVKKYGEEPHPIGAEYVDLVWILKGAIEKANSIDPFKVKAALDDPSYSIPGFLGGTVTFGGLKTYGRTAQAQKPVIINQVVGDTYKMVAFVTIEIP